MTVQEYLKQFSFDDILPPTRKMIEEWRKKKDSYFWTDDHQLEECKMKYDCICRIEGKPSKNPYLWIQFIDHRDIIPGYIGMNTWDFELVPLAECASKEIRYDGNPGLFSQKEIAAKLVYDLPGWRYSLDGESFQLDYDSLYIKKACLIYKRYAKHQLPGKQTRYFDEEWQDEYNLTVFSEDRNIIEKRERRCNGAKRKRNFRVKNRIKQLEIYNEIDYLIRRLYKNNVDGLSYTDFKWLFQIKGHANSTSKCKITKCFCKSTPLVLRNSIFFLVSH